MIVKTSVREPEPPRATTFRVEPEPIFGWLEPRVGAAFYKAAPAASFRRAKIEKPCSCVKKKLKSNLYR